MTVRKRHSNAFETSPEPPRGVVRLLGFLISKPDRDEVLGDVDERFAYRVAEIGEEGARLWYRKQMLGIAVRWPLFLFARKRRELERSRQAGSREREWEGTRMDSFRRDLVDGIRTLWGKKGFSAMIVLTLALAIGATTTIFSMVSTLILQPVPFSDPHQIGFLWMSNAELSRPRVPLSLHDYLEMKDQLTAFSDLAAFHSANFSMRLTDGDTPERLTGYRTTPNFFPLMGVEILQGRGFLPREARSDAFPVAVLSHGTWQRRFGSRAVLNEEIYLNGELHQVVGILAPEMEIGPFRAGEIWLPLTTDRSGQESQRRHLTVAGRLAPSQTLKMASVEADTVAARLAKEFPVTNLGWASQIHSLTEVLFGTNARTVLFLFIVGVSVLLLIGCANVLSFLGSGFGLLLTEWMLRTLVAVTGTRGPFGGFGIDQNVLMFALALAVVTPLVFGLVPALRIMRTAPASALKEGRAAVGSRRYKGRGVMVAVEVALSLVLLIVAGLASRSVANVSGIELGFEPRGVLTFRMDPSPGNYASEGELRLFYREILDRLASIPGVSSASLSSHRPILGGEPSQFFRLPARPVADPSKPPTTLTASASPGFFSTLGIPILHGREFTKQDDSRARRVALINQAAFDLHWGSQDALDSAILMGTDPAPWQVVGVVGNQRNPDADQPPLPKVYFSVEQHPPPALAVLLRTSGDPAQLLPAVRSEVAAIDPDEPIFDTRTMDEIVFDDQASDYAIVGLMSFFSIVALGVAGAGIYGVTAFSVSRRIQEFGVRVAVGARRRDLLAMIVRQSLLPVVVGLAFGLIGAYWFSQLIAGLLYGVTPTDPLTFGTVVLSLLFVSATASLLPAVRTTRMDLMAKLRD